MFFNICNYFLILFLSFDIFSGVISFEGTFSDTGYFTISDFSFGSTFGSTLGSTFTSVFGATGALAGL